ncbi:MAG: putative peptidoglycan glycosyltransferase FtsW [Solibacillus sp.]|jgi:cell division protein FtsW|uniref:FtsW/RodA/SpoVE family cell cycle protein n=1 Tax=unclassified Solibacillus TaxID=2637870 RepID=UPI0030F5A794
MFFLSAFILSLVGIVFIYSAGTYWSLVHYDGQTPFYIKQGIYFGLALVSCFVLMNVKGLKKPHIWRAFYILSLLLLIAVLIPGIGIVRNGSQSWIGVGSLTIQPAELAKLSTLIYLSVLLSEHKAGQRIVKWSHLVVLFLPSFLIMLQPDFGAVFILLVSALLLFFIAQYPIKLYVIFIFTGIVSLVGLIAAAPYRLKRIEAFINPWADPLGSGFQAVQSLLAIGPAGLFGHGLLKSRQKYLYLPEPQNDFIFSIILEEVGLVGGMGLLLIFACFLVFGYKLALNCNKVFHFYVICALTSMIAVQAFLNIGVVISLLPVTGVTLPFISYGGTSLLVVWLTVALILNFSDE